MPRLLIMRHAKSEWSSGAAGDHERPLAERGRRDAPRMGRFLAAVRTAPDLAVTSSALRARSSLELAAEAGDWTCPLRVEERIYEADAETLLTLSRRFPEEAESVLVVGHEPGLSGWCGLLGVRVRLPTAALACLDLGSGPWSGVEGGRGTLRWLVTPKLVRRFAVVG